MAHGRGPEIDPGLPGYAWVARIVESVERRAGTATRWNGKLCKEVDHQYAGSADDDGTLTIGEHDVMIPAEHAYTNSNLIDEDIRKAVDAAATVCHEARHLSSPLSDPHRPGAHPTKDAPGVALDEGLVERWTHANLGAVIHDIDMNRDVPGSSLQQPKDAYPAYTAATLRLVSDLAAATGRRPRDLEQQLLTCDASQRWNLMADMAIDHNLSGLMPEADREAVRARFANALRADFGEAREIHMSDGTEDVKRQQGTAIGARTIGNLNRDLEELADEHREGRLTPSHGLGARGQSITVTGPNQGGGSHRPTLHPHTVLAGQSPAAGAAVPPAQVPGVTSRGVSSARSPGRDRPGRS